MVVENLFIVRHGETSANEDDLNAGPIDYPLDKKGRKDVVYISDQISKCLINAVYSSPVYRAVETARIIARPHELRPRVLEDLTEAKLKPQFVGKAGRHHILTSPEDFKETYTELQKRMLRSVSTVRREADGNVVIVSHGDPIVSLLNHVVAREVSPGRTFYSVHPEPASLSIVSLRGRPRLALFNYRRKPFRIY